jgi:bifunctional non-homologous end joining protein LigD
MPDKSRDRRSKAAGEAERLREYRRKRDFDRTDEPAGSEAAEASPHALHFVVQKHAASHLHFDLRLELDGVMRSWAVPKGPSLDPAVRRLAMQVEDHPVAYNTFEGTIPPGEYGGGTVMIWDRGTYTPDELPHGADPEDVVRRGLHAGKLAFTLHGQRLTGSFALVRTEDGPKPKWLLLKHRDSSAEPRSDITAQALTSVDSGRTMDEIAADCDRTWQSNRAATPRRRRDASRPATAGDAIPPMKPTPARAAPTGGRWTFEPWRGGRRTLAYVTAGDARLMDDSARDITAQHQEIARELASLARRVRTALVLDGEIAPDDDGDGLVFHASDLLLEGDHVRLDEPWQKRRAALEKILYRRRLHRVRRQPLLAAGADLQDRARRRGWPGVLARRLDAAYEAGTRSTAFLRLT